MEENTDLVAKARAGDRQAFGELYDRYGRLVRAICYDRLSHQSDAEDLAQEVFVRAYRKLDQLQQPERFGHWVTQIARNMSKDWLRRNAAQNKPVEEPFFDQLPSETGDSQQVPFEELHQAIAQLPEQERTAIHLFYLSEQPAVLAQEVLQLSSSGFYKLLDRARGKLAATLQQLQRSPS